MADPALPSRLTINVLGDLEFVPATPELAALGARARQVLTLLALAAEKRHTVDSLSRLLRADPPLDPSAVHHQLKALRRAGVPILQAGKKPEQYWLDADRVAVDAWRLVGGVAEIDTDGNIDQLAQLWRADPRGTHPSVPSWQWNKIYKAREDLVRRIEGLDPADWPDSATLRRIAPQIVANVGPGPAAARRPAGAAQPRILIVDDLHAETIAYQAMSQFDCECDRVESFPEWLEFKEQVDIAAEYQAALVDLHLNGDPAYDDKLGLGIIKHLRDHTEIPVAVVSSAPGVGRGRAREDLRAEYRLVDIVDKGRENRYLNEIPAAVRLLLSDQEDCRRARLETWLMHAERCVRREEWERRVPPDRAAAAREEHRAADLAVRHGLVSDAAALVKAFCDTWLPNRAGP